MDPVKKPRRSKVAVRGESDGSVPETSPVASPAAATDPVEAEPAVVVQAKATDTPSPASVAVAAQAAAAALYADELADEEAAMLLRQPEAPRGTPLSVKLSHQLHSKLLRMARDEGVDLEALVQELLAEGVTLRAWEIIERKSAMRGQGQPQAPNQTGPGNRPFNNNGYNQQRPNSGGNNRGPGGNSQANGNRGGQPNRGSRPPVANNAWMEDKAAFLEYVRNQEKRRR